MPNESSAATSLGGTAVPPGNCPTHGYHGRTYCPRCSTSAIPPPPLGQAPTAATDRELKAWVWSFLICYAAGLLGAFGWGRHWNAYVCLLLTLGSVVLWATFVTAWKNRLGR